ncbi:hypothetical protein FNV43_RR13753 [Rhamnella rubrinervis]|uniref:GB1/RHD3-type G domain-containing protein n=1 Tax=Rhamnella rubrinervis TaxID=2594499 RepID=A0A8K0H1R8_9ROSA|nr:hypothetical protein FNV43_RR13753 [Rhamnella rubrinervis]
MTNKLSTTFSEFNFTDHASPMRFIYQDDNGKFKVDPEAIDALRKLKGPVGVISLYARARQGKNFILNQLLGSSSVQVGPTHQPLTKELWMWSTPVKRTAPDGTEYSLLLLDGEGIDAHEQGGTCSTQMFSLAVLLSSMFIYHKMGGIDEASFDQLSFVTEMTKHIRDRECGGNNTVLELGPFSPIFVWLLTDFCLDLAEDSLKVTPLDYLEIALRPVERCGKDIAARNEIRESIRALFPDRECFTLVHPWNNGNDPECLDRIHVDNCRPEFQSGLDAFTKFSFERTKPKQVRGTIMTGPILAGITKSYLDALNNGAAPSLSSSWQSAEQLECHRAYDMATEVYKSTFYHTKPLEEVLPREGHDKAVQESVAAFNANAVGSGSARQYYEELLQNFLRKAFEEYGRNAFLEADLRCSDAIKTMRKRLEAACQVPDAKIDHVAVFFGSILSEYEAKVHGPEKWHKLSHFLQQSLQGPILSLLKKKVEDVESEKSDLKLKFNSQEEKMVLLNMQLERSEKLKTEYKKHYESSINDMRSIDDHYESRVLDLERKCNTLEEQISSLLEMLNSSKQESFEWKMKFEETLCKKKNDDEKATPKIDILKSLSKATQLRVAAGNEKAHSAQKTAIEWKNRYDIAVREAEADLEKATTVQECSNKHVLEREDAIREEFSSNFAEKEKEIKNMVEKLQNSEQQLAALGLELKAAESKLEKYDLESSALKTQIKELGDALKEIETNNQLLERKVQILGEEKAQLEQKYFSEVQKFEEANRHCDVADNKVKMIKDGVLELQTKALSALNEKNNEIISESTGVQRQYLEEPEMNLITVPVTVHVFEADDVPEGILVETVPKMRDEEVETLLQSNDEQISRLVRFFESHLESERAAHAESRSREEALNLQLQTMKEKVDSLQQELNLVHFVNTPGHSTFMSASHGKHSRSEDPNDPLQVVDIDEAMTRAAKRSKSTMSLRKCARSGSAGYAFNASENSYGSQEPYFVDYLKFTVEKLRQEIINHGFGSQLLALKNPRKRDIRALYEKHVLHKD